jgi:hypothetical protein
VCRIECCRRGVGVAEKCCDWATDADADKANEMARGSRDDEGAGGGGEGEERKQKVRRAWYYKRSVVMKEEVLKRKE